MFRSMTAYAFRSFSTSLGDLSIQVQSVNRRFLEFKTSFPNELLPLDKEIKKVISKKVSRGQVFVKISLKMDSSSKMALQPNIPLALELRDGWRSLASALDVSFEKEFSLKLLKDVEGIFEAEASVSYDENFNQEVLEALSQVVGEIVAMKEEEGRALFEDIKGRVDQITHLIDAIEKHSEGIVECYRKKLTNCLSGFLSDSQEGEERILREICLYADRVDVAEEITRFRSHVAQFRGIMNSSDFSVGKKLEFLLQEMLRETNTLGSKTSITAVSHSVVDIKNELEKIKEQLQNIE